MPITHLNRRGDAYFLHEGRPRTGRPRFFFSRRREGTPAAAVPAGHEAYENPNAQVLLRKAVPRVVADAEVAAVGRGVRELAGLAYFAVDVKGPSIVVHLPNERTAFIEESVSRRSGPPPGPGLFQEVQKFLTYSPMMRFTLVEEEPRRFAVERWCFLGSVDDWFPLSGGGGLEELVARYCPHLGRESFYELV